MQSHEPIRAMAVPRTEGPAEPNASNYGSAITVPDQHLWQTLLWMRDQASESQRVLLLGEGASLAGILMARNGISVVALDADIDNVLGMDQLLTKDEPALTERLTVRALNKASLREALATGGYDTVAISSGYGGSLRKLLSTLVQTRAITRVVVAVPFGLRPIGEDEAVFPSLIVECLGQFGLDQFSVAAGQIRAVLSYKMGAASFGEGSALLRLTEEGTAESLGRLHRRIPELEYQLDEMRASWADADQRARELKESTSFHLGQAFVLAMSSPSALLRLPATIFRILRVRSKRVSTAAREEVARTGLTEWDKEILRNRVGNVIDQGFDAIRNEVESFLSNATAPQLAFGYLTAAQGCARRGRHDLEFQLASYGLGMSRSIGMLRGFLHSALRAREMGAACEALRELHVHAKNGNHLAEDFLRGFRETSSYKIAVLEEIPPRPENWRHVDGGRFVYVLHNSLPYSSGGYATRSHGVASGLMQRGKPVACVTRPGFPLDIKPDLSPIDMPLVDFIDGIPYQRVVEPRRPGIPEYQYVVRAMNSMEEELRRLKPAYVQGCSNYVTGLPALVAARRLGVPFFYEVRGLWEITRMSRDQQFAESISFDVQRHIEATLAREADHVFTLTEPMREELIERGVDPARITLLPNSVDSDRFQARDPDEALAQQLGIPEGTPVIGYIGTFVIYEGLEDLASACVELHRRGQDFRLLLVGNENASGQERGPITEEILRIAREGGIESKVILPGRVAHDQVESYYSLIDVCPFPRKAWPVCEMVSPMKPLEALAMKKAVVVSSVRALTEMIAHDQTGIVFEKGNVISLADAISGLMADPAKRQRLGEAGREWVKNERSWTQIADKIEAVIAEFDAKKVDDSEISPEASS